jgi:UvrD-like helicase family protein
MVPFPMLPTASSAERRLYEGFLLQLSDEYVVYHSVDWVLGPERTGGPPELGECDFLIAHPLAGLLVLEAKGGSLEYDPSTRRWLQAGRGGRHALDEDPFHQAQGEMRSLVHILSEQDGWDRWKPSYGFGVAFPDGRYDEDAHPGAPAAVAIDRDDLDGLDARVKEVMAYWRHRGRRFGEEGMEALERALGYRVEIRTPLRLRFDEEDRRIVELTEDQAYALSFVSHLGRAAVVGPAGAGKTVLAIQLANKLAAQGSRTLLTCFNKRLGAYLAASVGDQPNLDVAHFHGLCVRVAEEAGLTVPPAPRTPSTSDAYFERELPDLLVRAAELTGPRYDAMVVDEAQDFRPDWWPRLLRLHTDPTEGKLYVFSDSNQNLYEGAVPPEVGPKVPLMNNLRTTKAIHEFVSVFYRGTEQPVGRGPLGRPVEILGYRDQDQEERLLGLVLKNLEAEEVPLEDIVLLTPARAEKSGLRARGGVDGISFAEEPRPGTLLTSTIHGFKGLERPVVILADIGERHPEDLRKYLYVGASRARHHLIVLAKEPVDRELRQLTGVVPAG